MKLVLRYMLEIHQYLFLAGFMAKIVDRSLLIIEHTWALLQAVIKNPSSDRNSSSGCYYDANSLQIQKQQNIDSDFRVLHYLFADSLLAEKLS